MKIDNSHMHKFLSNFWDWMHYNWTYSSSSDGCCSSDIESFKEYLDKFLIHLNETLDEK